MNPVNKRPLSAVLIDANYQFIQEISWNFRGERHIRPAKQVEWTSFVDYAIDEVLCVS